MGHKIIIYNVQRSFPQMCIARQPEQQDPHVSLAIKPTLEWNQYFLQRVNRRVVVF
jgi:hypothetical protein